MRSKIIFQFHSKRSFGLFKIRHIQHQNFKQKLHNTQCHYLFQICLTKMIENAEAVHETNQGLVVCGTTFSSQQYLGVTVFIHSLAHSSLHQCFSSTKFYDICCHKAFLTLTCRFACALWPFGRCITHIRPSLTCWTHGLTFDCRVFSKTVTERCFYCSAGLTAAFWCCDDASLSRNLLDYLPTNQLSLKRKNKKKTL